MNPISLDTLPIDVLGIICEHVLINGDLKSFIHVCRSLRKAAKQFISRRTDLCMTTLTYADHHTECYCHSCGNQFHCDFDKYVEPIIQKCECGTCRHMNERTNEEESRNKFIALCPYCSYYCKLCGNVMCKEQEYCGGLKCKNRREFFICEGEACKKLIRYYGKQGGKGKHSTKQNIHFCKSCKRKAKHKRDRRNE